MTKKTLKALRASIRHWTRMATGKAKPGEEPIGSQCALCGEFMKDWDNVCLGCPVFKRTGKTLCRDTPYRDAARAHTFSGPKSRKFKHLAMKEVDFLKSLLPKRKKKKKGMQHCLCNGTYPKVVKFYRIRNGRKVPATKDQLHRLSVLNILRNVPMEKAAKRLGIIME